MSSSTSHTSSTSETPLLRDVVQPTGTEIAVVREIHRKPHATPSQLAASTGLHRSNISTAVRTLEAAGLVGREQVPADARSITLAPTALAAASIARINAYWVDRLAQTPTESLAEAAAALTSLRQIAASLEETEPPKTNAGGHRSCEVCGRRTKDHAGHHGHHT